MSREKLIRILCVSLVGTVLALALILVVAVSGGLLAETPVPAEDPHFRPFFPEGSVDIGDILESADIGDLTFPRETVCEPNGTNATDGDETLPPEPPVTLPPILDTEADIEWPTIPEDWETLPEDWDTLPPDWGDVELPDGMDISDLLAGMDGSLELPPGALGAGIASQLTMMTIYAERDDTLYLKMKSFGNYTGQGWEEALPYSGGIEEIGYSALYFPHFLMNEITPHNGYPLTITPVMDVRVIPYYLTAQGDPAQMQLSDVQAVGPTDAPYTLYYRPYCPYSRTNAAVTRQEKLYASFVKSLYLNVDDETREYLRLIIEREGFRKDDPAIIEKVATYIQNAADYNLLYDKKLDEEPNVAIAFLGDYKEGVCRHYATAATLLYRALGIPARYTVGFMTAVTAGETNTVKGQDAHAWVEVYEEGFGWRYVEVTGGFAGDRPGSEIPTDTTEIDTTLPAEPSSWGDSLAGTSGRFDFLSHIPPTVRNKIIFEVSSSQSDRLLLKLKSFGNYNGIGWENGVDYGGLIMEQYSAAYLGGAMLGWAGEQPQLLSIQSPTNTYAAPYYVAYLTRGGSIWVGDTRVQGDADSDAYEIYYYNYDGTPPTGGDALSDYEESLRKHAYRYYLFVDSETYAYLAALCDEQGWKQGDPDLTEQVNAYLNEHYTYNAKYDTALDSEPNVVLSFLFDYKEGNSCHFAAAATLLYRYLGIPARYTVGYLTETIAGETATVRGTDAYAWVEVYTDGFGWVPVDVAEQTGLISLTLKPEDMAVQYNGSPISHSGRLEGFENLAAQGYTYTAEVSGQRTDCGRTTVKLKSVTIYDPAGRDVTALFVITTKTGELHVYRAELWLSSSDLSKVYDGKPLKTTEVGGQLPEGYTIELANTREQLHVGTGYAAFDVIIWHGTQNCTDEFRIHKQYGTLTVTPASLTLKTADAEKVYDGTPLVAHSYRILEGELASGDSVYILVNGSQTRVGRSENVVESLIIRNAKWEDVTRNYTIEIIEGILKVINP